MLVLLIKQIQGLNFVVVKQKIIGECIRIPAIQVYFQMVMKHCGITNPFLLMGIIILKPLLRKLSVLNLQRHRAVPFRGEGC